MRSAATPASRAVSEQVVKVFDLVAARTGLREHEVVAANRGWVPATSQSSPDDHKAYYPGATPIHIRITGDEQSGLLLGAQLVGHRSAEIAKRVDTYATALFHTMTVDRLSELDLSYTPRSDRRGMPLKWRPKRGYVSIVLRCPARPNRDLRMHINRRAKIGLIVGATVLVAVVVAVLGISAVITRHDNDPVSVLPFTDLKGPNGVAVGSTGEVYVADELGGQVRKLAPGSTTQVAIPFDIPSPENPNGVGLDPVAIAVGPAGDIYVVDGHNDRVLKLAAGSTTPTVLPLADLADPNGVAVDGSGNVYIAESHVRTPRVLKLPADATAPTVLPLTDVKFPRSRGRRRRQCICQRQRQQPNPQAG